MSFGFGKRGRTPDPLGDDSKSYYGEDGGGYYAPPADAFQHSHTDVGGGGEFQDEYVEEDYGFDGSPQEGQFAGVTTTTTARLSEEQRQQLEGAKVGLTASERLAMIHDTANIKDYEASIRDTKRRGWCARCYVVIILAIIGLVVGLYFAFSGPGINETTNIFKEAWRPPSPTARPTRLPTVRPSAAPSVVASDSPSGRPSTKPTVMASEGPSQTPTSGQPSLLPSIMETESPSLMPSSSEPTTLEPTSVAPTTVRPSTAPSVMASGQPSIRPSIVTETESPSLVPSSSAPTTMESTPLADGASDGAGAQDGDNIFTPIVKLDCDNGTEIVTVYMADIIGGGWEGAELSISEDDGTGNASQPIFVDALGANEKARGVSLCLKTDTCYQMVVDGGVRMEEIRWGVSHTAIMAEAPTLFTAENIEVIESRATWLAPADCSFALYDACENECNEGYGVKPPKLDDNGNIIEKEVTNIIQEEATLPAAGQGNSSSSSNQTQSEAEDGNDGDIEADEAVTDQIVNSTLPPEDEPIGMGGDLDLLKQLFGEDFQLTNRDANECETCEGCLQCIDCIGASPDDEKCADCEPCTPCLGCVALPAPYNEGLSPEGILALVGIGSNSSSGGDDSLSGEALLKRLFGNDFELSMRNAPECVECTDCLPCIDCFGSENEDCARCEECSSSSCLGCIALSEPYSEGIGSGELFELVMGLMSTATTTAGNS